MKIGGGCLAPLGTRRWDCARLLIFFFHFFIFLFRSLSFDVTAGSFEPEKVVDVVRLPNLPPLSGLLPLRQASGTIMKRDGDTRRILNGNVSLSLKCEEL